MGGRTLLDSSVGAKAALRLLLLVGGAIGLVLVLASEEARAVRVGNEIYELDVVGSGWSAGTGPGFGAANQNSRPIMWLHPGGYTSDSSIQSFTSGTIYGDRGSGGVTPAVAATADGLGVTKTWNVNRNGDNFLAIHELHIGSSDDPPLADSSYIQVKYTVCNRAATPLQVGIRAMWDIAIDGEDTTYKDVMRRDFSMEGGYDNIGQVWEDDDMDNMMAIDMQDPGQVFHVYGLIHTPQFTTLPEEMVEIPDRVMFVGWGNAESDWYPSGNDQGSAITDTALVFFWGRDLDHAKTVGAGACYIAFTYITLDLRFIPPLITTLDGPFAVEQNQPVTLHATQRDGKPFLTGAPFRCFWTAPGMALSPGSTCASATVKSSSMGPKNVTISVQDRVRTQLNSTDVHVYGRPIASITAVVNDSCVDSTVLIYTLARDVDPYNAPEAVTQTLAWSRGEEVTANPDFPPPPPGARRFYFETPGLVTFTLTVADDDGDTGVPAGLEAGIQATTVATKVISSVGDPPCMPSLDKLPNLRVPVGSRVRIQLQGHDLDHPDGTGLLYSVVGSGFFGYELDANTGALAWDAVKVQTLCNIKATVKDPLDGSASQTFCITVYRPATDTDSDGGSDQADNCPGVENIDQKDSDIDGVGDACDPTPTGDPLPVDETGDGDGDKAPDETGGTDGIPGDTNGDGVLDDTERAMLESGPGHASSADRDLDGVADASDNCPAVQNLAQQDLDNDRAGDACDPDLDGDDVPQVGRASTGLDNCPDVPNSDQLDSDGDGFGDRCQNGLLTALVDETGATLSGLDRCRAQHCGAGSFTGLSASGAGPATVESQGASASGAAATGGVQGHVASWLGVALGVAFLLFVTVGLTAWAVRRWQ